MRNKEYRKICTEYTTGKRIVRVHVILLLMSVKALLLYSFTMSSRRILVKLYISTDHFDIHYKGIHS